MSMGSHVYGSVLLLNHDRQASDKVNMGIVHMIIRSLGKYLFNTE
jgi:hypothetical protein